VTLSPLDDLPASAPFRSEQAVPSGAATRASFAIEPQESGGPERAEAAAHLAREARAEAIDAGLIGQYMNDALHRHALGLMLASSMAAMCWPYAPAWAVLLWLGLVLAGTYVRLHSARHFVDVVDRQGPLARQAFVRRLVPFYAFMGLVWASSLLLFAAQGEGVRGFACWAVLAALIYSAAQRLAVLPALWKAFVPTFFAGVFCYFASIASLQPDAAWSAAGFLALCVAQFFLLHRLSSAGLRIQSALYGAQHDLACKSEEALAAVVAKNKFLAAATHDMRQPVIAMGLYAEFLQAEPESYDELAPKIGRAAQVVNRLFDSLFDLSAFDAGQVRLAVAPVSVASVIRALQEEYEPLAAAKGLTLRVRTRDATLRTDEVRLKRMIGNVLSNAIKYTRPGGKVLLAVRPAGDRVRVEVWDQGIGIPAAQIQKVFQEFFRADGGSQLAPDGLGIGLALVARLADVLRARVSIDSIEGRGTRVSLTLGDVEAEPARRVQLSAASG
jgi:signal transduction histidine kinase